MSILSIGDLAQSFMLRQLTGQIKTELLTLTQEMTTGRVADIAAKTSGDLAPLGALVTTLSQLKAFGAATAEAGLFTDAMQSALDVIDSKAADFAPTLLQITTSSQPATVMTIGQDADQRFRSAVSTLNTRVGDRSLFAGRATDQPALLDADAFLATLDTVIMGAVTVSDVTDALDDWFDDPMGYGAAYQGDDPLAPLSIGQGEKASVTVTAMDPAIRNTLKGLAMGALLVRSSLAMAPDARAQLAQQAGEVLIASQSPRTNLAAGLGIVQQQISNAETRNGAEETALEIARSKIVSADPYETATRLEDTRSQLETLYAITARLSRLSLTDYL